MYIDTCMSMFFDIVEKEVDAGWHKAKNDHQSYPSSYPVPGARPFSPHPFRRSFPSMKLLKHAHVELKLHRNPTHRLLYTSRTFNVISKDVSQNLTTSLIMADDYKLFDRTACSIHSRMTFLDRLATTADCSMITTIILCLAC